MRAGSFAGSSSESTRLHFKSSPPNNVVRLLQPPALGNLTVDLCDEIGFVEDQLGVNAENFLHFQFAAANNQ